MLKLFYIFLLLGILINFSLQQEVNIQALQAKVEELGLSKLIEFLVFLYNKACF